MDNMTTEKNILRNPVDFVFFYECKNSNPNGNPDGNGPRTDMETGHGMISDVCTKRKIRKFLEEYSGEKLYISNDASLNSKDAAMFAGAGVSPKAAVKSPENDKALYDFACENYIDIRYFGAAITSFAGAGYNAGQIAGAVGIGAGISLDPINVVPMTISRQALATDKEQERMRSTFGSKYICPYAVYRIEGRIDVGRAEKNGFTVEDAELLYKALMGMSDIDVSASRPDCAVRDLYVFEHSSKWRNIPHHKLMDAVTCTHTDPNLVVPRKYSDYTISLNADMIPDSVTVRHFD